MGEEFVIILHLIAYFIIGFILGGAWIQSKETNFGISAKFNCKNCQAKGCQAKFCKLMRKKRTRKL